MDIVMYGWSETGVQICVLLECHQTSFGRVNNTL